MDVEVLKKFDALLNLPYFIGSQFDNLIEAAIFGAEKKTDWVLDCLKYYEDRSFIKEDGHLDLLVLPVIMQLQIKQARKIILLKPNDINNISELIVNRNLFFLFSSEYFSPKNHQTGKVLVSRKTYTIHHYNNSWLPFISKIRLKLVKFIGVNNTEKIINSLSLRKVTTKLKRKTTLKKT